MRWCVSRSEVLQGLRALRRLELRDAEPPEDLEPYPSELGWTLGVAGEQRFLAQGRERNQFS